MYIKVLIGEYTRKRFVDGVEDMHTYPASQILVNPDCPIRIIYDYIQQTFDIDCEYEFDLSDEQGNLVYIYDKEPWMNGKNYFTLKASYFVVIFERDEDNKPMNPAIQIPEALRKSVSQANDLAAKIRKQLVPSHSSRGSRSGRVRSTMSNSIK